MNHILIIDDDHILVNLLQEFLELEGFAVDAAHDYDSGLNRALSSNHARVLLDVMFPGGSGLDLLETVRASSKIPVVLVSARGEPADRVMGLQLGEADSNAHPV